MTDALASLSKAQFFLNKTYQGELQNDDFWGSLY